jgi:hypothetical protein
MFYVWLEGRDYPDGTFLTTGVVNCPRTFASLALAERAADEWNAMWRGPTYTAHEGDPFTHRERVAAPTRDPYQIDPALPLELEDGTPVELAEDHGDYVYVRLLAEPTGPYAGNALSQPWAHEKDGGHWAGDNRYLRVRNVIDPNAPRLPAWKSKAIYAERSRPVEAQVPWKGAEWAKGEPAEVHFPHLAIEGEVPMVAFYASEQHAERERLTKMRPGRYLKRYFGEVLDNEEIERLTAEVTVRAGAMTVRWTQDADEIEEIYVNGPSSCMSEDADSYLGHCHPSRVYAGPDLAVAWLGDMDDATARCVVWPEKKQYGTIYGDVSRMRLLLEQQGFEDGDFYGARFRRIKDRCGNGLIMPYLDFGTAYDDGEFLIANEYASGRRSVASSNTCGTTEDNRCSCDRCGDSMSEDDSVYVEDRGSWCELCADHYAVRCDYSGERFADNGEVHEVHGSDDYDYVHADNMEAAGFAYVPDRGEWWAEDQTFTCEDCGEVFHVDDRASEELDLCEDCEEVRTRSPEDLLLIEAAPPPPVVSEDSRIDWTRPIEYEDGSPAAYLGFQNGQHNVTPHGHPEGQSGNYYRDDGTHLYGSYMSIRNVAASRSLATEALALAA